MSMPRDDLPFCDCRWLERAAHDDCCPVEFDPKLNEYNLKTTNGGSMRIYHCPFCSGRAPESLRSQLFAVISHEETARLHHLTRHITTEAELREVLGAPTHTFEPGLVTVDPEVDGHAPEVRTAKSLRYDQHSDTATISATVARDGRVWISFSGKYIGLPS